MFLVLSALIFMNTSQAVVEIALSIASFTYGGLLGTFILGLLFKKVQQTAAIIGFSAGITGMIIVIFFTNVGWTWYTLIGVAVTITTALLSSLMYSGR